MKKILYGVCGIGNGHTQRQLPLIDFFSSDCQIVIFAYDTSFQFYSNRFKDHSRVTVLEVAVPFYVGNRFGIDFDATEKLPANKKDFDGINGRSIAAAENLIGTPNVVISDYEPISAQYAYAHSVPLITIDQQSKYLTGDFPEELNGQTYADEVARLRMFFPVAAARIACSFFYVDQKKSGEDVLILPPIIKDSVLQMENIPPKETSLLVYFSSQKEFPQSQKEITSIFLNLPKVQFHVFAPDITGCTEQENVYFYKHGDSRFSEILKNCSGIVSTAGHTLLSEAMYLGIPVYAIPLPIYEQQMNAEIIKNNLFGIRADSINKEDLNFFVNDIPNFRNAIEKDERILLKGSGKDRIITAIEDVLQQKT